MPLKKVIMQNSYVYSIIILVGFLLLAHIVDIILKKYIRKLLERTKTDLDDLVLNLVSRPVYYYIILLGIYLALKYFPIISIYSYWLDNIFFMATVLIVSMLLTKILSILVNRWLKVRRRFEKTPQLLNKVITVIIYITGILIILGHFNIEITPLVATLGLGGLAIGLALQHTLSNFFAGLYILSDRPVQVGDFIELPDANISGYVDDIGWRSTKIKTLPNTIVIVPNSKLAESIIVNDSLPENEMAALVQVGVDYGSDLEKVEKVTIDVAKQIQKTVPGAVKTHEPFIRYHTFADSNINFTVILRVEKFVDKYLVSHEFIKALKKQYDKEKIEISWPVRKVYKAK